jgi:hypothetical protein
MSSALELRWQAAAVWGRRSPCSARFPRVAAQWPMPIPRSSRNCAVDPGLRVVMTGGASSARPFRRGDHRAAIEPARRRRGECPARGSPPHREADGTTTRAARPSRCARRSGATAMVVQLPCEPLTRRRRGFGGRPVQSAWAPSHHAASFAAGWRVSQGRGGVLFDLASHL